MPTTDQKIDELARMVAQGFSEIREEMTTKTDLAELRAEISTKSDIAQLRGDVDIMLDRHIGTFRRDYDELAARVKKLEEALLSR